MLVVKTRKVFIGMASLAVLGMGLAKEGTEYSTLV